MYIAMGGERAERLQRPERSLLDKRVTLIVGEVASIDEPSHTVLLTDGLPLDYDYLVVATGARITPEAIEHFDTNEYLQTIFPNIYACGDVAGPFQFTHTASHQAW